jgi:hypothetical protein
VTATASDDSGVQKVQFWLDGAYLGYDDAAPYTRTIDTTTLSNGSHFVTARAVDWANNLSSLETITLVVAN